jgi:hypothetical protein
MMLQDGNAGAKEKSRLSAIDAAAGRDENGGMASPHEPDGRRGEIIGIPEVGMAQVDEPDRRQHRGAREGSTGNGRTIALIIGLVAVAVFLLTCGVAGILVIAFGLNDSRGADVAEGGTRKAGGGSDTDPGGV